MATGDGSRDQENEREGFDLRIEFSGLCCFVVQRDRQKVAVLMPDARHQLNSDTMVHSDGTAAVPHAGYLRFDLGNLDVSLPVAPTNNAGPCYEVVHRFTREVLDLGLGRGEPLVDVNELAFPQLNEISRNVTLRPGLFGASPPPELLMRMSLTGGTFTSHSGGSNWTFPGIVTTHGIHYQGQFASYATWTRRVDGNALTINIMPFGNGKKTTLRLQPRNGIIRLKIANLCAENPLEWQELRIRVIEGEEDKDFKWFYRLLDPPTGPGGGLPVPVLDRSSGPAGIEQDCAGVTYVADGF